MEWRLADEAADFSQPLRSLNPHGKQDPKRVCRNLPWNNHWDSACRCLVHSIRFGVPSVSMWMLDLGSPSLAICPTRCPWLGAKARFTDQANESLVRGMCYRLNCVRQGCIFTILVWSVFLFSRLPMVHETPHSASEIRLHRLIPPKSDLVT